MAGYVGEKIINRLKNIMMLEYQIEEFAPPRKHADKLARAEKGLKVNNLRRIYEYIGTLCYQLTVKNKKPEEVHEKLLMIYPIIASTGGKKAQGTPLISRGLQKVLFACIEAVERLEPVRQPEKKVIKGENENNVARLDDKAKGENLKRNLMTFQRFLEAFMGYRSYYGG